MKRSENLVKFPPRVKPETVFSPDELRARESAICALAVTVLELSPERLFRLLEFAAQLRGLRPPKETDPALDGEGE